MTIRMRYCSHCSRPTGESFDTNDPDQSPGGAYCVGCAPFHGPTATRDPEGHPEDQSGIYCAGCEGMIDEVTVSSHRRVELRAFACVGSSQFDIDYNTECLGDFTEDDDYIECPICGTEFTYNDVDIRW